jgi:hypothetical protein
MMDIISTSQIASHILKIGFARFLKVVPRTVRENIHPTREEAFWQSTNSLLNASNSVLQFIEEFPSLAMATLEDFLRFNLSC